MARIRTIKPEFPQSETMGRLSRDARFLFVQLWTIVDDDGRARASSRMLASLLYPYDDDARDLIGGWLDELEHNGCVRRYTVDGSQYLDIPNWLKHQKIDKPTKSKLPAFDEASRGLARPREPSATDLDLGPGPGSTEEPIGSSGETATRERSSKRGTRLSPDWQPSPSDRESAAAEGLKPPDIDREAARFRDYWLAKAGSVGVKLDWSATWRNWVRKAADDRGLRPTSGPGPPTALAISPSSPSWNAWRAHYRDTGKNFSVTLMDKAAVEGKAFTVPSEYPSGFAA